MRYQRIGNSPTEIIGFGFIRHPLLLWTVIWDFGNVTTTEQPHLHRMPKTRCPDQIVIRSRSVSSAKRVPSPPARIATFVLVSLLDWATWGGGDSGILGSLYQNQCYCFTACSPKMTVAVYRFPKTGQGQFTDEDKSARVRYRQFRGTQEKSSDSPKHLL